MQTFLFKYGAQMEGKNIGLIVSSASSGISGVEADAKRLVPQGKHLNPSLWIRSSQTSNCHQLIAQWLQDINYSGLTSAIATAETDTNASVTVEGGQIKMNGAFSRLTLYNTSGRKMIDTTASNVSAAGLTSGLYVAKVTANGKTVARKLLID